MPFQTNDRLKALIKLLQTESDSYGPALKRELAAAIKSDPVRVQSVILEEFQHNTPLPVVHTLEEICWEDLADGLVQFSGKINPDLEEGLSLLSKFSYPSVTRQDIEKQLDQMAQTLRPALLNVKNYTDAAVILGRYFFDIRGIMALSADLNIKDISFARFLHKKKGSSLCVACLYVCICQRFGIEANIIDLAGRILVTLQNTDGAILFCDPLDKGKILTEQDCKKYIQDRQIQWNDYFLTPLSSRQTIRRFLANMIFVLNKLKDERRLHTLRTYLDIITG